MIRYPRIVQLAGQDRNARIPRRGALSRTNDSLGHHVYSTGGAWGRLEIVGIDQEAVNAWFYITQECVYSRRLSCELPNQAAGPWWGFCLQQAIRGP